MQGIAVPGQAHDAECRAAAAPVLPATDEEFDKPILAVIITSTM